MEGRGGRSTPSCCCVCWVCVRTVRTAAPRIHIDEHESGQVARKREQINEDRDPAAVWHGPASRCSGPLVAGPRPRPRPQLAALPVTAPPAAYYGNNSICFNIFALISRKLVIIANRIQLPRLPTAGICLVCKTMRESRSIPHPGLQLQCRVKRTRSKREWCSERTLGTRGVVWGRVGHPSCDESGGEGGEGKKGREVRGHLGEAGRYGHVQQHAQPEQTD